MTSWDKFLEALTKLLRPLVLLFMYIAARRSAKADLEAEQAKADAKLNDEYAKVLADRPEPGESTDGMRKGEWPT